MGAIPQPGSEPWIDAEDERAKLYVETLDRMAAEGHCKKTVEKGTVTYFGTDGKIIYFADTQSIHAMMRDKELLEDMKNADSSKSH